MTSRPAKNLLSVLLFFVLGNILVFLAYRLAFLWRVGEGIGLSDAILTALYGLRLDIALLGLEIAVLGLISLWIRLLYFRLWVNLLCSLTYVHLLVCVSNYLFFRERGQHMWEMFLANISQPRQIYIAAAPLLYHQPSVPVSIAILSFGFFLMVLRYNRALSHRPSALTIKLTTRQRAVFLILIPFALTLDPVRIKKTDWPLGWYPGITASRFYTRWDDYPRNQAVVNPVYEFTTYHFPSSLRQQRQFLLEREQALKIARSLLDLPKNNETYPLLREIRSSVDLGIQNVILIQVEGLTESLIHHEVDGRPVMPFLRKLAREALYFTNMVQSFDSTDGSVFSTVTGFPETFPGRGTKDFLAYDSGGHYASLSRILGDRDYQHLFFQAFRHRYADYIAFFKNQNYSTYGLDYFETRLKDKDSEAGAINALGVFDGVFLQETGEVLLKSPKKFTAHIVTATTHSPWTTPDHFGTVFEHTALNAFYYLDRSIEAFIETLRNRLPQFDQTLFAIVADHTSYLVRRGDYLQHIRVPFFLYNTRLVKMKDRWLKQQEVVGSHVDIVPTILTLLGGRYCYSGMGKSLLSPDAAGKGAISGNRHEGYYVKNDFIFRYSSYSGDMRLFTNEKRRLDLSQQYPEIFEEMKRDYFALYETSKRLAAQKNVFPRDPDACKLQK